MDWRLPAIVLIILLAVGALPIGAGGAETYLKDAASREGIVRDWMLQDYMSISLPEELQRQKELWTQEYLKAPESKPDAPVLEQLSCFVSPQDASVSGGVVERRMLDRVLAELGQHGRPLRREVESLVRAGAPGADPRWKKLYLRGCELRRAQRLAPLLARWQRFVFNRHHHIPNTWKYTEGLSCAQSGRFFKPGASLEVLEMDGPYGKVRTLIEDPGGMLRNPDVSYDGKRLLFAWKKSDRQDDYHLYEMDLDTQQLRQLTHGLGVADFEGVYLPDGNILFSSTRCIQTVDCNWTEVSNFYLMDGQGRYMRRVGFDQVHTVFPTVSDDGRILYTRWDYNDRAQIYTQPLFQMNMDGTNQREFYGGNSWFPTNIVHARKIPGVSTVLAVVTGHHMPAHGKLAIIDPAKGRQEGRGVQLIAPVRETKPIRVDKYAMGGNQFQHPYPLAPVHGNWRRFLVTLALPTPKGKLGRFNIYFMDRHGRRELLVEAQQTGEGIGCKQIVPLAPRERPYVRPSTVDYRSTVGALYLQDVYQGPGLQGIERGKIKRLRVVALKYRATGIGRTQQSGAGGNSNVSTPIAVGNGSWDVKVVLGTAKVYEDGSACFKVPARTPVYFQALNEKNYAVQTMRSWTTLMPGEMQSCTGCHEHKNSAPSSGPPASLAMAAGPQELAPFYGPPRGFSFAKEIQPILDRHCVECHTGEKEKSFSLSGETAAVGRMQRELSKSYLELTHTKGSNGRHDHPMVNWIDSMSGPAMLPPYYRGAATSKLMTLLEEGHEEVSLSAQEMEKIACWIDLLVPYCGDYTESNVWSQKELDAYAHFAAKRQRMEDRERANIRALIEYQLTGEHGVLLPAGDSRR